MMIDCGSCRGDAPAFTPYLEDLAASLSNKTIDLLIVTHEHNDHVNGFDKCLDIFEKLTIRQAWMAWTENPEDPNGDAAALKKKQEKMKKALQNSMKAIRERHRAFAANSEKNAYRTPVMESHKAFWTGLDSLAEINLAAGSTTASGSAPLPGLKKIKDLLIRKKVPTRYLSPGETVALPELPGLNFYVLGPPASRDFIFKDGHQGTDVYKKNLALNDSSLAVNAFLGIGSAPGPNDLPFATTYVVDPIAAAAGHPAAIRATDASQPTASRYISVKQAGNTGQPATPTRINADEAISKTYHDPANTWRSIDDDWMNSAGSLALRLNSHINNTSLVLAIEFNDSKKVLLFPGDAEYGSWESWHLIDKWLTKGKDKRPWAEDLLNRTVFYKVGHHLSYNGTAKEKGILMMESPELAAMATLDRHRIAKGWMTTMPNSFLMQELIRRTQGKFFIMDEFDITDGPSRQLDPNTLGKKIYQTGTLKDKKTICYRQFTVTGL
jgi:hypothetical protein